MNTVKPANSLKTRMLVGTLLLVTIALGGVSLVSVRVSQHADAKNLHAEFSKELDLINLSLREESEKVKSDLEILAVTPPIQGLARTLGTDAADISDGTSTATDWRLRLNEIFAGFLKVKPSYAQIRYIRADEAGQELVRVNRSSAGIQIVPPDQLQGKAGEFYFQQALNLKKGQLLVTKTTLNREYGQISEPRLLVTRFILPVFAEKAGTMFGFLVINLDTKAFLKVAVDDLNLEGDLIVVRAGEGGGWAHFSDSGELQVFEAGDMPGTSEFQQEVLGLPENTLSRLSDGRLAMARDYAMAASDEPPIRRVQIVPATALLTSSAGLTRWVVIADVIIFLTSFFVMMFFVNRTMYPIVAMQKKIQWAKENGLRPELPLGRRDEIGSLAREFDDLIKTLELREERVKYLFDGVRDGICMMDAEGRITMINDALKELLGYDDADLVGQDVGILMPKEARLDHGEQVQIYLQTGKSNRIGKNVLQRARRKDGSEVEIELAVSRIDRDGRVYFAALIRDVTERMQIERERDETLRALEASNEELDRFAYAVSHDLKSPLRAVATASQWLANDLDGQIDEDSAETLTMLRSRVERMGCLLDGVLAHARIGRQKGETQSEVLPGGVLAQELASLLDQPEGFKVEFTQSFTDIEVQQMPLQTVLLNLVSNAIKHHDRSDGRVVIDAIQESDRIRFTVSDDGPGIDPQFHDRIFALFQTLQSRDRVEGSGVGLALCRKYVKLNGGDITVKSDGDGTGTVFEFTWPAARIQKDTRDVA